MITYINNDNNSHTTTTNNSNGKNNSNRKKGDAPAADGLRPRARGVARRGAYT